MNGLWKREQHFQPVFDLNESHMTTLINAKSSNLSFFTIYSWNNYSKEIH